VGAEERVSLFFPRLREALFSVFSFSLSGWTKLQEPFLRERFLPLSLFSFLGGRNLGTPSWSLSLASAQTSGLSLLRRTGVFLPLILLFLRRRPAR